MCLRQEEFQTRKKGEGMVSSKTTERNEKRREEVLEEQLEQLKFYHGDWDGVTQ